MNHWIRLPACLVLWLLIGEPLSGQWYELSGGPGEVQTPMTMRVEEAANGQFVVYAAQDGSTIARLYRVAGNGRSDPVALTAPIAWESYLSWRISPDSTWLVSTSDRVVNGQVDLFSQRADGSGTAVRLNAPAHSGADVDATFWILEDSSRVVFASDQDLEDVNELFVVPIDGSQPPTRLNQSLGSNEDVYLQSVGASRVVYTSHYGSMASLYSALIDGSQPPLLLSGALDVASATVAPDQSLVVFSRVVGPRVEAYSVPADGSGTPTKFDLDRDWAVRRLAFTPDSSKVIITAEDLGNHVTKIFSADADASTRLKSVSDSINVESSAGFVVISPDGLIVAFREVSTNYMRLYVAPVDGSLAPTRLTYNSGDGINSYVFTPDSSRLVYLAYHSIDGYPQLWSVRVDATRGPVLLSLDGYQVSTFEINAIGDRVAYPQSTLTTTALWSSPSDGSSSPFRLSGPLVAPSWANVNALSRDSRLCFYTADQHTLGIQELYAAYLHPGAGIGLDIEPETPSPGDHIELLSTGGIYRHPCLWMLTGIDDNPYTLPVGFDLFSVDGTASLGMDLPNDPALSGMEFEFFSFTLNSSNKAVQSNRQEIVVQ